MAGLALAVFAGLLCAGVFMGAGAAAMAALAAVAGQCRGLKFKHGLAFKRLTGSYAQLANRQFATARVVRDNAHPRPHGWGAFAHRQRAVGYL